MKQNDQTHWRHEMNERINLTEAQKIYEKKQNVAWANIRRMARHLKIREHPRDWNKHDYAKFCEFVTKREWMRGLLTQEEYGMILTEANTFYFGKHLNHVRA
jgi:hypothetical protein